MIFCNGFKVVFLICPPLYICDLVFLKTSYPQFLIDVKMASLGYIVLSKDQMISASIHGGTFPEDSCMMHDNELVIRFLWTYSIKMVFRFKYGLNPLKNLILSQLLPLSNNL